MLKRNLFHAAARATLPLAVAAIMVSSPSGLAQSTTSARLTGSVTDPSGAVVPNTTVIALDTDTNLSVRGEIPVERAALVLSRRVNRLVRLPPPLKLDRQGERFCRFEADKAVGGFPTGTPKVPVFISFRLHHEAKGNGGDQYAVIRDNLYVIAYLGHVGPAEHCSRT
jgi:hypothetical protein